MASELKAPVFPESIEEGTVMAWLKQPGQAVLPDDKLAEIETDKVVLEVAAASAGVLERILKGEGETVKSGEVIGMLGSGSGTVPSTSPEPAATAEPGAGSEPAPEPLAGEKPAPEPEPEPAPGERPDLPAGISPSARKLIVERGLQAEAIRGSGRRGRITKEDVLSHLAAHAPGTDAEEVVRTPDPLPEPAPASPPPSPPAAAPPAAASAPAPARERTDERIPMSRIRARIAQRLVDAQQSMAILTTFNEVNMKPVMDLRSKYKAAFEKKHGVRLGFMPFFVAAAAEALKRYPAVNGSIDGNDLVHHHYYDIGIAVSSPRGLLVPILRDADAMSYAQIETAIRDFGARAQENRIGIEELTGGTFTISNGGVFGSLLSTPILNPPQSGILGMHNITERPVAENGEVVIRPVMYLALSYDHRIIDGREAVLFLVAIKELLEDPARLLLQV